MADDKSFNIGDTVCIAQKESRLFGKTGQLIGVVEEFKIVAFDPPITSEDLIITQTGVKTHYLESPDSDTCNSQRPAAKPPPPPIG